MRLLLCVSCVLGFVSLPALKASTSPAAPASPSATIPPVKIASLPTVTQGSTISDAAMKPSPGTSAGVDALKPSTTALVVGAVSNNVPTTPSSKQVLPTSASATVITMSASGPQGSAGTVATVSKHKESSSKPSSHSEAASFSAPTVAALTPPTTNRGTLGTSAPDRSKPSVAHTQLSSTSAESNTPGSSLTGQSMTSAVSSVAEGHHSTAGPTPSKETSEQPPKNVILDPSSEATSTVSGSSTPIIPPEKPGTTLSTTSVSSTPAKFFWSSSLPGDQQRVSSSPSTSEVPGSIPSGKVETYYFPGIKLTCFLQDFPNQSLVIQTQGNMPSLCNDGTVTHAKELLAVLCETVKPGFKFSENKDNCTVKVAHKSEQPHKLAVLEVAVKTNAAAEDIDKELKGRTEELKKLGFLLDNKSGIESLETYEDKISIPLIITIVCLAAALLLIAAIYSCCHQRQRHRKDQRLTEELQTMENGYHDNPTLEVMETSPEMQEKKPGLNGDLGDSWIVPMDNLTKDDMDDAEEDTHL